MNLDELASNKVPPPVVDKLKEIEGDSVQALHLLEARLAVEERWVYEPTFEIEAYERALEDFPSELLTTEEVGKIKEAWNRFVCEKDRAVVRVEGASLDLVTLCSWARDELSKSADVTLVEETLERDRPSNDPPELVHRGGFRGGLRGFRGGGSQDPPDSPLAAGYVFTVDPVEATVSPKKVLIPEQREQTLKRLAEILEVLAERLVEDTDDDDRAFFRAREALAKHALSEIVRQSRAIAHSDLIEAQEESWQKKAQETDDHLWFWNQLEESLRHPHPPP